MTILDTIIAEKQKEIIERKNLKSISQLEKETYFARETLSFSDRLAHSTSGIIAEFKRKSPSRGWIHREADVNKVTSGYSQNGASAISILTDYPFFGGTPGDLMSARKEINVPVLRKDFIIDEYQLFEAKAMGADVILLIAAALSPAQVRKLSARARDLSLQVLLEIHNETELEHICPTIDVVGINNRNLKTFVTDIRCSFELGDKIPEQFIKISESGISDPETVKELRKAGFRGFLMGENFMKEKDPAVTLKNFIQKLT